MLGLQLANRLAQRGDRVTLIEGADRLGGLASAWRLDDVVWDRHYHVTLQSDSHLRGLIAELGLEDEMRWISCRTGCFADGKLYSVSSSLEMLRFPLLGLIDKIRLGATLVYGSRIKDGRPLERIPVAEWLRRWSGQRTYERFWLPLLRSKLGEAYQETSAAFIWATIRRLYAARRAGLRGDLFGYLPGGYARLLDRLGDRLRQQGVSIRLGQRVQRIRREDSGHSIVFDDGEAQRFDRVIVTAAAPIAAALCPELTEQEIERLRGVRYLGIVCASVLSRRSLGDFYVTNLLDEGLPFTGVIEMSALVDKEQFDGHSLIYLPRYLDPGDPYLEASDSQIEEDFLTALQRVHPDFDRDDVRCFRVSRVRQVFALATLGYSDRLPPIVTSVPGLYLANSAHIVNATLNVNETLQLAERALESIAESET